MEGKRNRLPREKNRTLLLLLVSNDTILLLVIQADSFLGFAGMSGHDSWLLPKRSTCFQNAAVWWESLLFCFFYQEPKTRPTVSSELVHKQEDRWGSLLDRQRAATAPGKSCHVRLTCCLVDDHALQPSLREIQLWQGSFTTLTFWKKQTQK